VWAVVAVACGLPLAWLVGVLVTRPEAWRGAVPDAYGLALLGRTLAYTSASATLALILAVAPAIYLGLSRRAAWVAVLLPLPLLLPSVVLTYGWSSLLSLMGVEPRPASALDVARCVVALGAILWPAPCAAVAFFLARLDPGVVLQARLDGAVGRVLVRLLAGPAVVGWLVAWLLASQEFAVFEPTGIRVVATEVRAVFETGAFLREDPSDDGEPIDRSQSARTAAALAVLLPTLAITAGVVAVGAAVARGAAEGLTLTREPVPLRLGVGWAIGSGLVVAATLGLPVAALAMSLRGEFDLGRVLVEYAPQLGRSIGLGAATAAVGVACMAMASVARPRGAAVVAIAAFLVGGQWSAIALIRVFNRDGLGWLYDSPALAVVAYLSRFLWVALLAASVGWGPDVRWLRDLAASDGAGGWRGLRYVLGPVLWPLYAGAAVLVLTLAVTEVPATTLLQPAGTIVPLLMTWAHTLRFDPMIEAGLLLSAIGLAGGCVAGGLLWMSHRGHGVEG